MSSVPSRNRSAMDQMAKGVKIGNSTETPSIVTFTHLSLNLNVVKRTSVEIFVSFIAALFAFHAVSEKFYDRKFRSVLCWVTSQVPFELLLHLFQVSSS